MRWSSSSTEASPEAEYFSMSDLPAGPELAASSS